MEDDELEVKIRPFVMGNRLTPDGSRDYWLYPWNEPRKPSPSWTEFDQFVREMFANSMDQVPQKLNNTPNTQKRNYRPDNIGGYTFFSKNGHVKRTENGGDI